MERPSRGRAHTFTGAFASLFSPFKAGVKSPPVPETIGWKPNTLNRKTSGLSQHHVLGSRAGAKFEAAPNLMRQLSSATRKDSEMASKGILQVEVTELASPGAQSYSSSSSSQRVAFIVELLKPADTSQKSGNKVRQRAPSPYPDPQQLPLVAKPKEGTNCEPLIRSRARTLTMERMDGVNSIQQYLDAHPDTLPPPGSTPAFVEQYWHLRRLSLGSSLSDPGAEDGASDVSDAGSNTYGGSEDSDPGRWECDTAYESDDEYEPEQSPRRQCTPAATRPPLMRHARTWPLTETPWHDNSPATQAAPNYPGKATCDSPCPSPGATLPSSHAPPALQPPPCPDSPAHDTGSWLPTDPSNIDDLDYAPIDLPRLLWKRDLGADGRWFTTSLRPPPGTTAGQSGSAGGPSHTPERGYFHAGDPRLAAVDAEELARRLRRVGAGDGRRASSVDCAYDAEQERIRLRYAGWRGGAVAGLRGCAAARTACSEAEVEARVDLVEDVEDDPGEESSPGARAVEAAGEEFPSYRGVEDCFMHVSPLEGDGKAVLLPDYAAADPNGGDGGARWPRTGCLPKSRAHRQRAASKGDAPSVMQQQQQRRNHFQMRMVEASGVSMARATALATI